MMRHNIKINYLEIFTDNYIWLITNHMSKKFIAIDPGDAQAVVDFAYAYAMELAGILVTHHHADHTAGISELKNYFNVEIFGPIHENIAGVTERVAEADSISFTFIDEKIQVLDTPGHTLGHISYVLQDMLFCGDTLFSAGCGRLFEGTHRQLYASLQKLAALPDKTKIYCTHEYTLKNLQFAQIIEPNNVMINKKIAEVIQLRNAKLPTLPTCLSREKQINPFLRCHVPEVKQRVAAHCGVQLHNPVDVFQWLRVWKDNF